MVKYFLIRPIKFPGILSDFRTVPLKLIKFPKSILSPRLAGGNILFKNRKFTRGSHKILRNIDLKKFDACVPGKPPGLNRHQRGPRRDMAPIQLIDIKLQ